jgi:hypothetical protein
MWASAKEPPELVLGREPLPDPSGYVLVGEFHQRTILKADRPAWLYARADVAAARGILTNLTAWVW